MTAVHKNLASAPDYRRVFALINPVQMEIAAVNFLMKNIRNTLKLKDSGPRLICVDGKEEKGTGRKYCTDEEIRNHSLGFVLVVMMPFYRNRRYVSLFRCTNIFGHMGEIIRSGAFWAVGKPLFNSCLADIPEQKQLNP